MNPVSEAFFRLGQLKVWGQNYKGFKYVYHPIHLLLSNNGFPKTNTSLSLANESIQMEQLRQ